MSELEQQYQSEDPNAGYATPIMDLIAAGVLAAISVWMIVESLRLPVPGGIITAPGLLPFLTAASLLLMAVILGAGALKRQRTVDPQDNRIELPPDFARSMQLGAIVALYILAMHFLPVEAVTTIGSVRLVVGSFEVSSVIALTAILRIYWRNPLWQCLLITAGWIAFLSVTFRVIFHIQLP